MRPLDELESALLVRSQEMAERECADIHEALLRSKSDLDELGVGKATMGSGNTDTARTHGVAKAAGAS